MFRRSPSPNLTAAEAPAQFREGEFIRIIETTSRGIHHTKIPMGTTCRVHVSQWSPTYRTHFYTLLFIKGPSRGIGRTKFYKVKEDFLVDPTVPIPGFDESQCYDSD